jgi:hypothetical protein
MAEKASKVPHPKTEVSVEEVNRILEVGRLLLSVLTPEELEDLGLWVTFSTQKDPLPNCLLRQK